MNCRIIAKFCLLLVIIGFFMPWGSVSTFGANVWGPPLVEQLNGLQSADSLLAKGDNSGILIYVWFIFALAGLLIGVLLLLKKNVPFFIDWLIAIACTVGPIVVLNLNSNVKSGLYTTLIGAIVALIFQFVSAMKTKN
jgi:hypothetical protein